MEKGNNEGSFFAELLSLAKETARLNHVAARLDAAAVALQGDIDLYQERYPKDERNEAKGTDLS